jgi:hypothetical protein
VTDFTMKLEGGEELQAALANLPRQVKFATAVGMNRTIDEAQAEIKAGLSGKFTLRRKAFVEGTIYRKPGKDWATKDKLEARVQVNPDRNVLEKFEAGGTKAPTGGRRALAIPIAVKRNKSDIVTKANSVKALLASKKAYIRDGKVWLLQGRGKIRKRVLAYVFAKAVPLKPTLRFVETGRKVIEARGAANVAGAIEKELAGGLSTGTGAR